MIVSKAHLERSWLTVAERTFFSTGLAASHYQDKIKLRGQFARLLSLIIVYGGLTKFVISRGTTEQRSTGMTTTMEGPMVAASGNCQYPTCGYNPQFSTTCPRVRRAYGECCSPCDGPCYIVRSSHYAQPDLNGHSDTKGL